MINRRDFVQTAAATGAFAALAATGAGAIAATPLQWKHFPTNDKGFFRAPVLLSGTKEAILIDAGFSLPDGRAVAEAIKASGKKLTTIYISQSDPDYYFSLAPIKAAFPGAKVIAASETIAAIRANVQKKIDTWAPQLKENGPQKLDDIVFAEAFDAPSLVLEGNVIEIVKAQGLENRRYLWVPSLKAVFKDLQAIAARKPVVVVPGHLAAGGALDVSAVTYTRDYLLAFEEELAKAANADALIAAMNQRYPNAGLAPALQIGAKVAKGEMKWG